jgi:hypothetical protein
MNKVIQVLSWLVLATLMLAIARTLSERDYPIPRETPKKREGFLNGSDAPSEENPMKPYLGQPQMLKLGDYLAWDQAAEDYTKPKTIELLGQNPLLQERRKPYTLLGDTLPEVKKKSVVGDTETAQKCFESNYRLQSDKVGTYTQKTNNYKHATPDSCSSPLQEFVGNFYELETLPTNLL